MTDKQLAGVEIRYSPLSRRVLLARFGSGKTVALGTKDVMSDFLKALVSYAFDGRMPKEGEAVDVEFGASDEKFVCRVRRVVVTTEGRAE